MDRVTRSQFQAFGVVPRAEEEDADYIDFDSESEGNSADDQLDITRPTAQGERKSTRTTRQPGLLGYFVPSNRVLLDDEDSDEAAAL